MSMGDVNIGVSGFFDLAYVLYIDGQAVAPTPSTYGYDESDYYLFTTPSDTNYSGITVEWQHFLPEYIPYARIIYTFTNVASSPTTFNADFQTNLATPTTGLNFFFKPLIHYIPFLSFSPFFFFFFFFFFLFFFLLLLSSSLLFYEFCVIIVSIFFFSTI